MFNLEKIIKLTTENLEIVILFFIVFMIMYQYFQVNIILILILLFLIIIFKNEIINIFENSNSNNHERIIENNTRKKKELYSNKELNDILLKIKKFRKYNQDSYDKGMKYLEMFLFIIHDLEKDDISHPRQYFENAELYLSKSLNYFQSISISAPEENFIEALKYNKFNSSKLSNKIGLLCKDLHKHCYYLLYNLSLRFNEDWKENPDIYKSEISYNYENVKSNNEMNIYELY